MSPPNGTRRSVTHAVIMGVTGCGKTTVARGVAERVGAKFLDADDFHSKENVAKMQRGEPLTDADREGWLDSLRELLRAHRQSGKSVVLACSALKQSYRARLGADDGGVLLVHLSASPQLIKQRLEQRRDHFMPPSLIPSQFAILEPPESALTLDAAASPEQLIEKVRDALMGLEAPASDL